jgi:hypothetical protein
MSPKNTTSRIRGERFGLGIDDRDRGQMRGFVE